MPRRKRKGRSRRKAEKPLVVKPQFEDAASESHIQFRRINPDLSSAIQGPDLIYLEPVNKRFPWRGAIVVALAVAASVWLGWAVYMQVRWAFP